MGKGPASGRKGTGKRRQRSATGTVRKNFNLPQEAIDRAREALGTKTETETVLQALENAADVAAFRRATDAVLSELVGAGGFEDRFAPEGDRE